MEKGYIHTQLTSALTRHFPDNEVLLQTLQSVLNQDRKYIQDKLDHTTSFTLEEVETLFSSLPLDAAAIVHPNRATSLLKLCYYTYDKLTDTDFQLKYDLLDIYKKAADTPNNSFLLVCNMLPDILILSYVGLRNLYHLKWIHFQNDDHTRYTRFEDVVYSERFARFAEDYQETMSHFRKTYFIFGNNIIRDLVEDIHYFRIIGLLSDDSVALLKEETIDLLNKLESIARKGYDHDPKKEVIICIANTSIQNWYTLVTSDYGKVAMFQAFYLNYVYTDDAETVEKMQSWIHSMIQSSTVISQSGEKERVTYFTQLRTYVEQSL
ncbi:MAG: hypothetical protein LUF04_06725 [Bacteroides sp.]|nr:hypothetical protein [Bacteroides sp.]MCD8080102.1 hypothetical protein [Bacteroides sp.]